MGCCLSSDHSHSHPPHSPISPSSHNIDGSSSDDVKEVLPESTTPPPAVSTHDSPFIKLAPLLDFSTFPPYADYVENNFSVTEKRRNSNSGELRQRRSPARSRNGSFSGEKPAGRSPGRRSDSSPNRVNGSGYGRRRECEERRSRSPGMRAGGAGTPGQGRKTGRSPGRVGSGLGERTRKLEMEEKWAPNSSEELLENPLVSLECFIFL